ncbi:MAG: hypothetical protein KDK97_10645 [Verrucomicrobiales bacterium]|nr:hypothetical protein [Verrucomicrobiales bacterium]MCP5558176.1 hypothetical protein [Verrucomicrobiaceae bacterium]
MTDSAPDSPFAPATGHDPFQAAKASAMKAAEELRAAAAQKAEELRGAVGQKAAELRSMAGDRADTIRAAAGQRVEDIREKAGEIRDYAGNAMSDAKDRYEDLRMQAEKFAREKPVQALLTAFGAGFLLGAILRR